MGIKLIRANGEAAILPTDKNGQVPQNVIDFFIERIRYCLLLDGGDDMPEGYELVRVYLQEKNQLPDDLCQPQEIAGRKAG